MRYKDEKGADEIRVYSLDRTEAFGCSDEDGEDFDEEDDDGEENYEEDDDGEENYEDEEGNSKDGEIGIYSVGVWMGHSCTWRLLPG